MKLVGDFLARFQNLTPPHDALKRAVVDAVFDVTKVRLNLEQVAIQNGVAFIKTSSVARNMVHVHRGKILETVFQNLPKARDSLRDIR